MPQSMPENLKDEPKLYEMWRTSDKDSLKSPAEAAIANLDKVKQLGDMERVVNPVSFATLAAVAAIYLVPGLAFDMLDPEQITMGLPAAGTAAVAGPTILNL